MSVSDAPANALWSPAHRHVAAHPEARPERARRRRHGQHLVGAARRASLAARLHEQRRIARVLLGRVDREVTAPVAGCRVDRVDGARRQARRLETGAERRVGRAASAVPPAPVPPAPVAAAAPPPAARAVRAVPCRALLPPPPRLRAAAGARRCRLPAVPAAAAVPARRRRRRRRCPLPPVCRRCRATPALPAVRSRRCPRCRCRPCRRARAADRAGVASGARAAGSCRRFRPTCPRFRCPDDPPPQPAANAAASASPSTGIRR